jgi:hypothetical protein
VTRYRMWRPHGDPSVFRIWASPMWKIELWRGLLKKTGFVCRVFSRNGRATQVSLGSLATATLSPGASRLNRLVKTCRLVTFIAYFFALASGSQT